MAVALVACCIRGSSLATVYSYIEDSAIVLATVASTAACERVGAVLIAQSYCSWLPRLLYGTVGTDR